MQENINIPDSGITTNLSFRQLVLMNMQQLTNFPYIEKDFDALTDYELLSLVVKFLNDVIANQNEQNDSITRMYQSFLALQDYVNNTKDELETAFNNLDNYVRNYFDNLDVQEEINNKLDQMLKDGVLEQIIEQFLQSTALWCFDTVSDMKNATNLTNGSYAKTLGYYSINDGGSGVYKITNDVLEDNDGTIIKLNNNLYAVLIINNEYNIATLGASSTIDNSTNIQSIIDSLGDNITLYVPEGTFKLNIVLKNKNMKVYGKGTIKGSIEQNTTFIDTNIEECYNEISGIKFTKDENNYAIKLQAGRNFKICNVNIDDSFDYGIYYNYNSSFSQRINRVLIDSNVIYSKYGLYLKDESSLGCADITFSNNILYSTISNVYLDGIDGFKDNNNTYFMPGHNTHSTTKEYNFYANRIVWLTINGSTFFEAGLDSIHLTKYQNVNITNNLIAWGGQRVRSSGIYLGDYDTSGNGLYNITSVSNNIINAPAGNGITVTTNTGRISINNNRLHAIGSSQYYYGETDARDTYGIYYPLVNDNMFCSVTNNICENKISSLSTRLFRSNNIEPNNKPSGYRLTEEVSINDTFQPNTQTSKTLSYTVPTGYVVNNIRVKSMDPTNHSVQYTVNMVGNIAVIRNNYTSALTTTIVFEVEYVKVDSFI